jgi:flavin-dependent dehydrogenase
MSTNGDIPASCDVAVIGGGPAGSTAASLLGRAGFDVVLLEKARHPRYLVGESLIPHFWKYAELIGADDKIMADGFIEKAGGTVAWNGVIRQMRFRDFGFERPAMHVERDRFDAILLDHSRELGARVYEGVGATSVQPGEERSRVAYRHVDSGERGELSCRFVLDASGQGAVVSKELGTRIVDEAFRFMSIWGYFTDSRYVAADGKAYPFELLRSVPPTTFVTNLGGWSWAWHIPQRDSTSVGLVLGRDQLGAGKGLDALQQEFVRLCLEHPYLGRLLDGAELVPDSFHVIRNYSYRPSRLVGPGYFLIGDAAAFVDPIFSIGIVLAMYSAYLASWAVGRAFKRADRTEAYQATFAQQFGSRLETSRALALPRYGYGGLEADLARTALGFETAIEQELMYVVSTLTTRSENFEVIARDSAAAPTSSERYRVIEEIAF